MGIFPCTKNTCLLNFLCLANNPGTKYSYGAGVLTYDLIRYFGAVPQQPLFSWKIIIHIFCFLNWDLKVNSLSKKVDKQIFNVNK